jgi:zinc protease
MTNAPQFITLPNGLSVHLKEIHTAPIISTWVWYRVGSRNEVKGKTGLSHWVEHMQFKGTQAYPAGILDRAISRVGGVWNALTHLDWTTYFETLPADIFDISLSLEADRMANSQFLSEEVERERTVIISEREGNENQPQFLLVEAVQKASFAQHPYQHEVIGEKEDLLTISRDDLYQHYRKYYQPANAVVAVAGDFNTAAMLERIEQSFGSLAPGEPIQDVIPADPLLNAEQRVQVTGPGETSYVQIAYRAPSARDQDFFTLTVLDSLLTGPSSLNMFGSGGTSNKTSRLYRALVEGEIAVSCHGGLQATLDPYLYTINLTVHPSHSPDEVLKAVDQEIQHVLETPVTAAEIDRAIKQAKALFAFSSENISNQAFWLGYSEMFDRYNWFENYVDHLAQVTPEKVLNIAQTYLQPNQRVVGFYTPEQG